MKPAQFVIMIVLISGLWLNAKAGEPVWVTQAKTPSLLFKHPHKQAIDLCREYKRKVIAGNVLIPAGACALGGGLYLIYKGSYNVVNQLEHGTYEYRNQPASSYGLDTSFRGSD